MVTNLFNVIWEFVRNLLSIELPGIGINMLTLLICLWVLEVIGLAIRNASGGGKDE